MKHIKNDSKISGADIFSVRWLIILFQSEKSKSQKLIEQEGIDNINDDCKTVFSGVVEKESLDNLITSTEDVTQVTSASHLFRHKSTSFVRFFLLSYIAILSLLGGSGLVIREIVRSWDCGRIISNVRLERIGDIYTELDKQCDP